MFVDLLPREVGSVTERDADGSGTVDSRLVLYIEDNAINLELMQLFFEDLQGLRLIAATTAEQGIELAQETSFDLILMDIDLPGLDGISATRELKARPETAEVPVIAISASAMADDIDRASVAAFDAYVTKPFKLDEFSALMQSVLDRRRD